MSNPYMTEESLHNIIAELEGIMPTMSNSATDAPIFIDDLVAPDDEEMGDVETSSAEGASPSPSPLEEASSVPPSSSSSYSPTTDLANGLDNLTMPAQYDWGSETPSGFPNLLHPSNLDSHHGVLHNDAQTHAAAATLQAMLSSVSEQQAQAHSETPGTSDSSAEGSVSYDYVSDEESIPAIASANAFLTAMSNPPLTPGPTGPPPAPPGLPGNPQAWDFLSVPPFLEGIWGSSNIGIMDQDATIDYVNEDGNPFVDFELNLDLATFLSSWAYKCQMPSQRMHRISAQASSARTWTRPQEIYAEEIKGDAFDMQGVDWENLGTTKKIARAVRMKGYTNYRSDRESSQYPPTGVTLPASESYFRFRKTNCQQRAMLAHFQLRNLLTATSKNDVYFANLSRVIRYNPAFGKSDVLLQLPRRCAETQRSVDFKITTLAAAHGALVVGGFGGEYAVARLDDHLAAPHHEGIVTTADNGITNHVAITQSRTNGNPVAVFSSNDRYVRTLDMETQQFLSKHAFQWPVNCTAISPDSRLRVVVGDDKDVLVVSAETGEVLTTLTGHHDFGFACAWSEDGYTVATGNQDKQIRIYDARNWRSPVAVLAAEQAGVRSFQFSPLGSGKRVLMMCEPADIVHLVDAVTFKAEQKYEFFGEIGGAGFTPDGSEMYVANCDRLFGGLMEFERWGASKGRVVPRNRDSGFYDCSPASSYETDDWEWSGGSERKRRARDWDWDWEWDPDPRLISGKRWRSSKQ